MTVDIDAAAETTICPVCGGNLTSHIPYLNTTYAQHKEFKNLQIAICDACGMGITIPEKSYKEIQGFYQELYRGQDSVHQHSDSPRVSKYSVTPRALSQWLLLKTFRTFRSGDTFLDIGPGGGATFETARLIKLAIKMFAYEIDRFSVEKLKKLGVQVFQEPFHPTLSISEMPEMKFSGILLSHVLEHFSASESLGVLRKIKDMLSDGGIFLCEVPNSPMKDYAKLRFNDAPHLTFWTKEALAKAIESVGMQVLFLSGAGEMYQDCHSETMKSKDTSKKIWSIKGLVTDYFPEFVQNILRSTYRFLKLKSVYDTLAIDEFQYGDDRVYLRAVCSLRKS